MGAIIIIIVARHLQSIIDATVFLEFNTLFLLFYSQKKKQ
jgi:hypothetical protein